MKREIKKLCSEVEIKKRVSEIAREINSAFQGQEVTVIGVLKGAFLFMADLVRELTIPVRCDFVRVSSYKNDKSTGIVRLEFDVTQPVKEQNVLLIEDIVDSGRTLDYVLKHLRQQKPKNLKVCTLLYKEGMGTDKSQLDYIGFSIPNKFVIGYGLDSMGLYRTLPYIGYFEE